MRRLLVVLALVGCGSKKDKDAPAPTPTPTPTTVAEAGTPAPVADEAVLGRGRYLVGLTGCAVCHTAIGPMGPDMENAFAGGLTMPDTIGTWTSPNITPDTGTGIGGWTDEQIVKAIREGVRPDGRQLYPIMPYMQYNRMTDADAKAIVAFLRTVKPVQRPSAVNKLNMPEMKAPPPSNGPDDLADAGKHGAYLTSLMLCSHCHFTPGPHGEPSMDKMYSGGLAFTIPAMGTGTIYAANITSDEATGIGKYSVEQIASTMTTMVTPAGRKLNGPMTFLQGGWSQIQKADLDAVAGFIKALPPVANQVPASDFVPAPPPGAPPEAKVDPAKAPDGCGMRTDDWCAAPAGDPCGAHKTTDECKADKACRGMQYTGESAVACMSDGNGYSSNCPNVGCASR